ncbi:HAD-IA family hydrolase [Rhodovulum sulfidophilum]|uniref:HAD-IA family hydrolase n=1 Tax=Rhodovulum sulfidophilum TaxID=35806 RepID=UPI000952083F|nr:HAD-IA family hydrolase [Rhodovulum sulfidophilum]MBL3554150.1 HAD-IA family hydrolase [Rhodovulum sulfidophilum]OLS48314.1 hypothetical protein BV379_08515 [Rhodovulum sulfidophilum]
MKLNHIDRATSARADAPEPGQTTAWDFDPARIAGYPMVTFDVFETLLERRGILRPLDLFLELGRDFAPSLGLTQEDFADLRIRAERDARAWLARRHGREVRLAEIYDRFGTLMGALGRPAPTPCALSELADAEMALELSYLTPVPSVAPIYREALSSGKKVALISDFYAPASFVAQALAKNGFDGDHRLFVSSDLDKTKNHGELYAHVCQEMGVSPRDVVHFGDNPWSDGARALQAGITHVRVVNPAGALLSRLRMDWRKPHPLPASTLFAACARAEYGTGLTKRQPQDLPVSERVGIEALAPLLLGMASWLYHEAQRNELKALHFCSRDGLVMKQAFDMYQERFGKCTDSRYLMVSRQAIYRARAVYERDAAEALFVQNWSRLTPGEALARWGLAAADHASEIAAAGFADADQEIALGDGQGMAQFARLFHACRDALQAANEDHAELFADYLAQEGVTGAARTMLVDIGWHGSLQHGLTRVLDGSGWTGRLAGRYLGLFLPNGPAPADDMQGYLFSKDRTPRTMALRASPSLVELLHTAGHGSTVGYQRDGGRIVPQFENRPDETAQYDLMIRPIQETALRFMAEVLDTPRLRPEILPPEEAFRGLDRLLNRPDPDEVRTLGQLQIAANYGANAVSIALAEKSAQGYRLWNYEK